MASPFVEFAVIFGVIFAIELVDRTFFALIALAARYRPTPLWLGAVLGFAAESLIAIAVGALIGAALSGEIVYVRIASGVFILAYAGYLALKKEGPEVSRAGATAFTTAFVVIFLLELGDTTWIVGLNFALANPPALVAGAMIGALACVAGIACLLGSRLGARVEPRFLNRLTIVILVIVGVLTIVSALLPGLIPPLPGPGSA